MNGFDVEMFISLIDICRVMQAIFSVLKHIFKFNERRTVCVIGFQASVTLPCFGVRCKSHIHLHTYLTYMIGSGRK